MSDRKQSDMDAGFVVSEDFERFNQLNDMFTRAFWDDSVRSKDTDAFFEGHRVQPLPRTVSYTHLTLPTNREV